MKLVFVIGTLQSGGAERVVAILTRELLKYDYDITIVCYYKTSVFYVVDKGVEIVYMEDKIKYKSVIGKIFWFRKYINSANPDVVIAFMNPFYLFTLFSLLDTKTPILISDRNDPRRYSFIRRLLARLVLFRANRIIVQTQSIKEFYSMTVQRRVEIIYNPVESCFKTGHALEVKKNLTIYAVGRLTRQKNYSLLIKGFARFHKRHTNYTLKIIGDGELYSELNDLIVSLSLESSVFLLGKRENIVEELVKASFFVITSNYEGMSNSLIEALCLGLPVISTKTSGAIDIISHGKNGILIDLGSENQLVDAFEQLQNTEFANFLANNASKLAILFSTEKIVEQWHNEIKSLVLHNKTF